MKAGGKIGMRTAAPTANDTVDIRQATPKTLRQVMAWAELSQLRLISKTRGEESCAAGTWVLTQDGAPIAYALLRNAGAVANILAFEVKPEHRGKGHGRTMATAILAVCKSAGANSVLLKAEEDAEGSGARWDLRPSTTTNMGR
jgi:GNAT superfamily N-acetyltransferase